MGAIIKFTGRIILIVQGVLITLVTLQAQTTFKAKNIITDSAEGAESVYVADLNGNGKPDVLSASWIDNTIAWYENLGYGHFSAERIITDSIKGAKNVFAIDIDKDGDSDVLSSSQKSSNNISWYENDGNGNFSKGKLIASTANPANSIYASDLDGDGDPDVLAGLSYKIVWYENDINNGGGFSSQKVISNFAFDATSVYAVDLDDDGNKDVLASWSSAIVWYKGNGSGNFGVKDIITDSVNYAKSVHAADLNNDGVHDVISASQYDNKIAWYENNGSGYFPTQKVITDSAEWAESVYAADLDNDNDKDIISASRKDNTIAWYENDGQGNFSPPQVITTSVDFPQCVYSADLDGDNDMDVFSASSVDNTIAWFENQLITGVSKPSKPNHKLYPNPTTGLVKISTDRQIKSLFITDITGKTIRRYDNLNTKEKRIDLSGLETGIYLARIHTEKGVFSAKVIKE